MARYLGTAENELRIFDNLSGSDIVLKYRTPTTKERNDFTNYAIVRKRNRVEYRVVEAQTLYGARILTGIRDGDFEVPDEDGAVVPLSSNPASPNYRADWKELLTKHASDIVQALGAQVFDRSVETDTGPDPEDDPQPAEADDLEKN